MNPGSTIKNDESRGARPQKPADGYYPTKEFEAASGNNTRNGILISGIIGIIVLFGLYFISLYNYLLFHSLVEIFAVVVAGGIFFVTWNSREFSDNRYFLFLGIAYLFIGALDLLHALAYSGNHIFPGDTADVATQLWITARYIESISLLVAPLFFRRKVKYGFVIIGYLVTVSILLGTIFYWKIFPVCFTKATGLTAFKKNSEYIISFILLAAMGLLFRRRKNLDVGSVRLLIASMALTIASEMAFTLYISVYGLSNLIGHYLKVISFYLIYKAVIEAGLQKPYNLLFRNLKQSERRYRALYKKTPAMLHSIDKNGRLIDVSNRWLEIMGYGRSEVIGRKSTEFLTPKSRKFAEQIALPNFFQTGSAENVPFQFVKKNGDVIDVLLSAVIEKQADGGFERSLAVCADVTAQQQARASLRQSEARFQSLIESSMAHIFMLDPKGYYLFSNNALHHLEFDSGSDIINRHLRDVYPPELAAFYLQKLNQVLSTGNPVDFEHTLGGPDDLHYHLDTLFPIKKNNSIESVGGICRDITARKHAEQKLKQHVERLQMLRDIDRAVLELQPPAQIAKVTLPRLRKIIPCNRASVCLFDRQSREIVVLAVDEDKDSHIGAGSRLSLEKADLSRVVLQGEIQLVKDIKTIDRNFPAEHVVTATGARSYLNTPLKFKKDIIGSLNFGSEFPDNFDRDQIEIAQEAANSLSVALQNARLFGSISEHREQLRVLALRLSENEEIQRRQLVREVHDQVGQNLTALNINLNIVLNALSGEASKPLYKQVEDALGLVTETTVRIRNLMSDLRPPVLDDYGLTAALEWYAEKFSNRYGLPVKTLCDKVEPRLGLTIESVLFRIAQEALTNVAKHARAGQVLLELDESGTTIRMKIGDDGQGFTITEGRRPDTFAGWGLMTMQERMAALGGRLIIRSQAGQGTTIEAVVER